MSTFTLIGYRPDHIDTCRGCTMGRSGSQLEIEYFEEDQLDQMIERIIDLEEQDEKRSLSYAEHEITILLDGRSIDSWEFDDERMAYGVYRTRLQAARAARVELRKQQAETAKIAAERAAAEKAERDQAETRRREVAELARLTKVYGSPGAAA